MKMTEKKQIRVLAKHLRQNIATKTDMEAVMKELFKGKAEVSSDNQGQLVIYTGHSYGLCSGDVTCMETKEFLDS
jgi:DNA-binding transcriptional regulator/RsmH inhibitor MraZ